MNAKVRIRFLLLASLSFGAPLVGSVHHAMAQGDDDAEAEADAQEAQKKAEARAAAKAAAPPAALPGASSSDNDSGHASADLNPTDALFDAVNRGSLNAAKESLNRGADMGAHNVLGQTALDMAIDLNRNDIIFLLLSMRTNSDDGTRVATNDMSEDGTSSKGSAGHLRLNSRAVHSAGPSTKATAARYVSNGGTARPEAGFLGFNGN